MLYIPIITIRATHSVMMSRPVSSTDVGYHFAKSAVAAGQPSVLCGHSALLNQVSRTSGSCTQTRNKLHREFYEIDRFRV